MDDIIVYSLTIHAHPARLTQVFKRPRNSNLKIQLDECEQHRKEVAYLGPVITKDDVKPNPSKVYWISTFIHFQLRKNIETSHQTASKRSTLSVRPET